MVVAKRRNPGSAHKHGGSSVESGPAYTVQIADPISLRRDLLESLREIIIFIQGYEKFRKLQEEKVATFAQLKADVKDLNSLLEYQLRRHFPKGKLGATVQRPELVKKEESQKVMAAKPVAIKAKGEEKTPLSELDELETQLKDIENQLQGIK